MSKLGSKTTINGKSYTLKAVADSKYNADRDARVLKRHGYTSTKVIKKAKTGYATLPRWLVYAR